MRFFVSFALLFFLALPASAQEKKPWYRSKTFWAHTAIVVGLAVADGEATARCRTCLEGNRLLGRRPSRARLYLVGAAAVGARRGLVAFLWRRDEKMARALSWTDVSLSGVFHGFGIASNVGESKLRVCPANGAGCP